MFESNQDIHFSCTQCGKCCEKPPRTNFYEMLELSDKFIFQTAHHTMISYASNPLDKSLCEHYQIIGHTIMMPEIEASLFYFIDFIPIPLISYKTCPQLKDNLCTIYGSRPNSCRIGPFSAFYNEQEQWKTVNFYESNIKNNWKCSFKPTDPIIYQKNNIHSYHVSSLYYQEISHIREATDKYIEFLSLYGEERKNNHFKALFEAMEKNSLLVTDIVFMLQAAISANLISPKVANSFIKSQKILLEKELNFATELKNKENLNTSRIYKRIIEDYEKILITNLFNQQLSDSFEII
jgi:Fe-S-cluster containining protein